MTELAWCKKPDCNSDYCQLKQARANLFLAEEGLANYAQSNETLALQRDHWLAVARTKDEQVERLRALLMVGYEALLAFTTTYNGRPSKFREAEIASGECIMAACDKLDEFLFPEQVPQTGERHSSDGTAR